MIDIINFRGIKSSNSIWAKCDIICNIHNIKTLLIIFISISTIILFTRIPSGHRVASNIVLNIDFGTCSSGYIPSRGVGSSLWLGGGGSEG